MPDGLLIARKRNTPRPPASSKTITLFLSLYLLVLAFFILLVAISSTEEVKSKAVMDSLTSTFSTVLPPTMQPTDFNTTTGDIIAAEQFQQQITGIFSAALKVTKINVIQPGKLMHLRVPSGEMFELGADTVRDTKSPLLTRIVSTISSAPEGLRYEMEFVVPVTYVQPGNMIPKEESLDVRRAGTFARELLSRGAPPGSVIIGVEPGEPGFIDFWFHIRRTNQNQLSFDSLIAGQGQAE